MMQQPVEFSLESVRQLMLANGGRITNHDLVKSYKRWLTDPQEKENARAQFKDYVNTLATIKQDNGEKYLLLKKKFYPEYYANNYPPPTSYDSYNADSNYNSAEFANNNSNYPVRKPSSSSYQDTQPHVPHVPSYSRQNSGHSLQPLSNGNSSPSLLDEVMAGWAPVARSVSSVSRQLPSIPAQPQLASGHNSLGLPSVAPAPYSGYSRQSSVDSLRSSGMIDPSHVTRDTLHYNAGFNPHMSHQQQPDPHQGYQRSSVTSLGSVASGYSANGYSRAPGLQGYVSSPPSSYSGSPRGSVAPPPVRTSHTSLGPPPQSLSRAPPPYRAPPPDPVHSQVVPPEPRLPPPPPDPSGYNIQTRPLPDRPRPADPVLPPPLSASPPPPPRRTVPSSEGGLSPIQQPPPPLPKRQLPSTANLTPLDLGLPIPQSQSQGRSRAPSLQHHQQKYVESQQPSPTDSGFTEDPSKFSDYPLPRNTSLSKSIGNLTVSNNEKMENKVEGSVSLDNLDALPKEDEKVVSVRERTKTFNRMASETELPNSPPVPSTSLNRLPLSVKRRNSRAVDSGMRRISNRNDPDDTTDSSSITTIDPTIKQWMVQTSKGDYQAAAKMLMENPKLARHRDFTNGYTGLHWAAKHGNTDMVKLLAGTYQANVNAKSHGGYSPLHIAAQHNHQEVFDLLVQVRHLWLIITGGVITGPYSPCNYGLSVITLHCSVICMAGRELAAVILFMRCVIRLAGCLVTHGLTLISLLQAYKADANLRDFAGKKPRQYMIIGDTAHGGVGLSISSDTFRQLKDRRKNRASRTEKNPGILRFGSLSVKVRVCIFCGNGYDDADLFRFSGEKDHRSV